MVRGSLYSVIALGVAASTGAVFWLIAARNFSRDEVGSASALFTSVLFVTFVSNLGLPVAVARFAGGDQREYDVLFARATVATVVAAIIASAGYFVVVDPDALQMLTRSGSIVGVLAFAATVAGTSLAILLDVRLMVARRWGWMVVRVAAVGVLRLPFLWVDNGVGDDLWLFLLAAGPPAASGVIGLAALRARGGVRFQLRPRPAAEAASTRYAAVNYMATLAADGPRFAVPVLVLLSVSARANASFYVAWSVTALVFLVPATIGQVLLVEAARAEDHWGHVRAALALAGAGMVGAASLAWARADVLTSVYGDSYGEAARILPQLMAAGIPWTVTSVALADARVRGDTRSTLAITVVLAAAILGPALLLIPSRGVDGAADAWLWGHLLAGVVGGTILVRARLGRATAPVSE